MTIDETIIEAHMVVLNNVQQVKEDSSIVCDDYDKNQMFDLIAPMKIDKSYDNPNHSLYL